VIVTYRCGATLSAVLVFCSILFAPLAAAQGGGTLEALLDAATERLQTAEPVTAVKWRTKAPIDDPPRVQDVLTAVGAKASARGIDPDYVTRVFTDQINATTAVEYARFADWTLDPASAPATSPDLAASRATIDSLNSAIVDQVITRWDVLHGTDCRPALDVAMKYAIDRHHLDALYQRALRFATRSYCIH
jgi:chorismate mutase